MILQGDWIKSLKTLPAKLAHTCITSPPYWGLRDYGVEGQLGLEATPDEYVANIVEGFGEVKRVLRDDGTVWLNLGDSYATSPAGNTKDSSFTKKGGRYNMENYRKDLPKNFANLKPKDLCGIPWRVAFALQADGWFLRQDIIWAKPNPMPESVTDRCTKAHEYIFLLTKSAKYYYDAEAIKEPATYAGQPRGGSTNRYEQNDAGMDCKEYSSRNKRSVWTVNTSPCPDAHFATFPPKLIEPCILAGTSEKGCCPECGSPWERVVEKSYDHGLADEGFPKSDAVDDDHFGHKRLHRRIKAARQAGESHDNPLGGAKTLGWQPTCSHDHKPIPCTVLDCFGGAGTTAIVSIKHGRKYILCELNQDYIDIANKRIAKAQEDIALFAHP